MYSIIIYQGSLTNNDVIYSTHFAVENQGSPIIQAQMYVEKRRALP